MISKTVTRDSDSIITTTFRVLGIVVYRTTVDYDLALRGLQ